MYLYLYASLYIYVFNMYICIYRDKGSMRQERPSRHKVTSQRFVAGSSSSERKMFSGSRCSEGSLCRPSGRQVLGSHLTSYFCLYRM